MALDECDGATDSFGPVAGPLVPDRGANRERLAEWSQARVTLPAAAGIPKRGKSVLPYPTARNTTSELAQTTGNSSLFDPEPLHPGAHELIEESGEPASLAAGDRNARRPTGSRMQCPSPAVRCGQPKSDGGGTCTIAAEVTANVDSTSSKRCE